MSDTEVTEGQAPEDTQPQAGDITEAQEATPSSVQDTEDSTPAAEQALKQARSEAAKYRKRLRELEAQAEAAREAEMSETERLAKQLADAQQTLQERDAQTRSLALESAVAVRSNALGIVDAEVAVALLDREALDYDDSGRPDPESLDAALKRLIKSKPYLKQPVAPASPANPARSEPVGETDDQRRARLFGGGGGIFDPDTAARLGGGVITSTKE